MRACLPHARLLIHQPVLGRVAGAASDVRIAADEASRMRRLMETAFARHTGKSPEEIHADIEREKVLTAEQAKEYGIVDEVVPSRKVSRR